MHTQTVEAATWWARSRGATASNWVATYQKSLQSRHRDVIVQAVRSVPDVTSVLEVGSHCGPNLIRIAQACPGIGQLTGIDVNTEAVTAGNRWVSSLGLSERIALIDGRVPDKTSELPDGCVDVVLSCYALAYIAPADLDAVLYEMGRLAKRALVLAEPMTQGTEPSRAKASLSDYREWAHNYQAASRWINTWRGCQLRVETVTPPVDQLSAVLVAVRAHTPSEDRIP